jgi:hypothetical protein
MFIFYCHLMVQTRHFGGIYVVRVFLTNGYCFPVGRRENSCIKAATFAELTFEF